MKPSLDCRSRVLLTLLHVMKLFFNHGNKSAMITEAVLWVYRLLTLPLLKFFFSLIDLFSFFSLMMASFMCINSSLYLVLTVLVKSYQMRGLSWPCNCFQVNHPITLSLTTKIAYFFVKTPQIKAKLKLILFKMDHGDGCTEANLITIKK